MMLPWAVHEHVSQQMDRFAFRALLQATPDAVGNEYPPYFRFLHRGEQPRRDCQRSQRLGHPCAAHAQVRREVGAVVDARVATDERGPLAGAGEHTGPWTSWRCRYDTNILFRLTTRPKCDDDEDPEPIPDPPCGS